LYVIAAEALAPAWKPIGVPLTEITTGNVATPELDDAIAPSELTDPVADAAVAVLVLALLDDPLALDCVPVPPPPPKPPPPKPPPPGPKPPAELVDVADVLVGVTVAD
jgi:hypothetical protein